MGGGLQACRRLARRPPTSAGPAPAALEPGTFWCPPDPSQRRERGGAWPTPQKPRCGSPPAAAGLLGSDQVSAAASPGGQTAGGRGGGTPAAHDGWPLGAGHDTAGEPCPAERSSRSSRGKSLHPLLYPVPGAEGARPGAGVGSCVWGQGGVSVQSWG